MGKTVYALLCCPDEEFSLEPVISLGNGIFKITGVSIEEEDFCNVSRLVISRKESVSAHSHIYFSHVFLKMHPFVFLQPGIAYRLSVLFEYTAF